MSTSCQLNCMLKHSCSRTRVSASMSECSISPISTKRGTSYASYLRRFPSLHTQNLLWRRIEMTTSQARSLFKPAIEPQLTPFYYYTIIGSRDTTYRRGWWDSSTMPRLYRWWPLVPDRQPWSLTRTSAACSTMNKYLAKWGTLKTRDDPLPTTQRNKQLNRDLNRSWQSKLHKQYKMTNSRSSLPQLAQQLHQTTLPRTTTSSKSLEFHHRIDKQNGGKHGIIY